MGAFHSYEVLRQRDTSYLTQVEMTVVSALFMLPAGVIFPALQRAANTPPASQTLDRVVRKETPERPNYDLYNEFIREQDERKADFQRTLRDGMGGP